MSWAASTTGNIGCGGITGATPLSLVRAWINDTAMKLGSPLLADAIPEHRPGPRLVIGQSTNADTAQLQLVDLLHRRPGGAGEVNTNEPKPFPDKAEVALEYPDKLHADVPILSALFDFSLISEWKMFPFYRGCLNSLISGRPCVWSPPAFFLRHGED